MPLITDDNRSYTILFPKTASSRVEMLDEIIRPTRRKPAFETLACDVAGCVIAGTLTLEVEGQGRKTLKEGDAFYVRKGERHRGYAAKEPARLITVCSPARY
jgi:mannose-6-phosphate isomerase-like protein (cupin superfamily)